jgi:hypothetical protein
MRRGETDREKHDEMRDTMDETEARRRSQTAVMVVSLVRLTKSAIEKVTANNYEAPGQGQGAGHVHFREQP